MQPPSTIGSSAQAPSRVREKTAIIFCQMPDLGACPSAGVSPRRCHLAPTCASGTWHHVLLPSEMQQQLSTQQELLCGPQSLPGWILMARKDPFPPQDTTSVRPNTLNGTSLIMSLTSQGQHQEQNCCSSKASCRLLASK